MSDFALNKKRRFKGVYGKRTTYFIISSTKTLPVLLQRQLYG
jgi:hypothetical protein